MKTITRIGMLCALFSPLAGSLAPAATPPHHVYGDWNSSEIGGGGYLQQVHFCPTDANRLYMTSDVGGIFRSDDLGKTWRMLHGTLPAGGGTYEVRGLLVNPADADHVIIACGSPWGAHKGIFITRDGGKTWKQTLKAMFPGNGDSRAGGKIIAASPVNPKLLVAAADEGVYRSEDFGETWTPASGPTNMPSPAAVIFDKSHPDRVWLCLRSGKDAKSGLFISEDAGKTFQKLAEQSPSEFVQDPADSSVLHGILNERPHRSSDLGKTWTPTDKALPTRAGPREDGTYAAIAASQGMVVLGGHGGNFYLLDRKGDTWKKVARDRVDEGQTWWGRMRPGMYNHFGSALGDVSIDPKDAKHWYFTDWYACYETVDAGTSWTLRINGVEMTVVHTVVPDLADPKLIHVGMADLGYFRSSDGGGIFSWNNNGISNNIKSIATTPADPARMYAVGPREWHWYANQVFSSSDGGLSWKRPAMRGLPNMDEARCNTIVASPRNADEVYLAVSGEVKPGDGGIYRSKDAGNTWQWISQGMPGGGMFRKDIWVHGPEVAASADGGLVAISCDRNKLMRYDGAAWKEIPTPGNSGGTNAVIADPSMAGRYYLAMKEGGLLRSDNGGESWTQLSTKQTFWVAVDPRNPRHLATSTQDGVLASSDGGVTWIVMDSALPYKHPRNVVAVSGGRVYVGTGGNGVFWAPLPKSGPTTPPTATTPKPTAPSTAKQTNLIRNGEMTEGTGAATAPVAQGLLVFTPGRPTPGVLVNPATLATSPLQGPAAFPDLRLRFSEAALQADRQHAIDVVLSVTSPEGSDCTLSYRSSTGSTTLRQRCKKSPEPQTIRFELDNTAFNGRDPEDIHLQPPGRGALLHSIQIIPFDNPERPDYRRLLRLTAVANPDDLIFMYPVSKPIQISYKFQNLAVKPVTLVGTLTLVDRREQTRQTLTQSLTVAPSTASSTSDLAFSLNSKGLAYGQYSARLVVMIADQELLRKTIYLGVISDTQLPKAKPGEFLFGLDASLFPLADDQRLLRFTRLMGTDIIRGGIAAWHDRVNSWTAQLEKNAPIYQRYDLKCVYMIDVPDNRIKNREAYLQAATEHLEWAARTFKDLLPYYELGNEPDIGFFNGPIELYVDGYLKTRAAIKRGNPQAVVMNGGWAYDTKRINRFYELVKPADVDVIAYHGHGDVNSERRAFQSIQAIATANGFGDKILADTESGIMALAPSQEEIQARVCVQKLTFAQAYGQPLFLWFRLAFDVEGEYSCTWERTQPRPSVMAYRATVEALRGYRFKTALALPDSDSEAYLFEQIDGPGRCCVLWVNGHATRQATLRVAAKSADAQNVELADIYGNRRSAALLEGGIAAIAIGEDPVLFHWNAAAPFAVAIEPRLLQVPPVAEFQVQASNPLTVEVRNPLDQPVAASLSILAKSDAQLTLTPSVLTFNLKPQERRRIDLTATVGTVREGVVWPARWAVFVRTAPTVDLATLTTIPAQLPGVTGPVAAVLEVPRSNKLDLARLGNHHRDETRVPAIVMGTVESNEDRTVRMGAGADFWMEWYLNGQRVYDTLGSGNGPGYTIFDHTFEMNLKKGSNLLVARALSGAHGWTLAIGSPAELEKAAGASLRERLDITYSYGLTNRITESIGIEFLRAVESLGTDEHFDSPLDVWEHTVPSVVLADRNLVNLHFKDPDVSRWWKGYADLSASAWLRADADWFYMVIKSTDDIHRAAPDADRLADFDSITLALSPKGQDDITAYRIGLVDGKTVVVRLRSADGKGVGVPVDAAEVKADVLRTENTDGNSTVYRVAIARRTLGADQFFCNFLVNDNDAGIRKQYLQWKPGIDTLTTPGNWSRVRLSPAPK